MPDAAVATRTDTSSVNPPVTAMIRYQSTGQARSRAFGVPITTVGSTSVTISRRRAAKRSGRRHRTLPRLHRPHPACGPGRRRTENVEERRGDQGALYRGSWSLSRGDVEDRRPHRGEGLEGGQGPTPVVEVRHVGRAHRGRRRIPVPERTNAVLGILGERRLDGVRECSGAIPMGVPRERAKTDTSVSPGRATSIRKPSLTSIQEKRSWSTLLRPREARAVSRYVSECPNSR